MDYILSSINLVIADPNVFWMALIVLLALFTRAAIGFGDGVIAVPLLSLMIDISEAVPFILFISTLMSFVALWKDRAHVQFGSLKRTASMALLGFPFGILLLGVTDNELVKSLLGCVLIIMAIWFLSPAKKIQLKSNGWSYFFGLLAGVLGGAYAFRGIVFGIYGSLRGWSPAQFKGTIHSFFLLSGIFIPFGYFGAGLVTPRVIGLFFVMMPVALFATLVGTWFSGKLNAQTFQKVIWSVLLLLGIVFIVQFISRNF
ncbi:sulfite exporter TauE/SafE family protein [uncultured Cocleimonas sp.]|uniref:sulfite exporter TauE/SafE family protein n=1 Tax=uncultured Cocleimonas sp. TaxID=1051587 RepID=UPI0026054904|nr:sulfite exporter TauE/SafE family protein [uncultured Cocleimonas sp.]